MQDDVATTYPINDNIRPVMFSGWVALMTWSQLELVVLWIDVLGKVRNLSTKSGKVSLSLEPILQRKNSFS